MSFGGKLNGKKTSGFLVFMEVEDSVEGVVKVAAIQSGLHLGWGEGPP